MKKLYDLITKKIGIDPGSENFRLSDGYSILFDEPSQISVDIKEIKVSGFGNSIVQGKNQQVYTSTNYLMTDFTAFEQLLRAVIKKSLHSKSKILQPLTDMYFALPTNVGEVVKSAYRDSAEHCGARTFQYIFQAESAAIAMNILLEKQHFILVDIGASKIEVSIFSDSQIIASDVIRFGTVKFKRIIRNYILRNYQIIVPEADLENILLNLTPSSAFNIQHKKIIGADILAYLSKFIEVAQDLLQEVIEQIYHHQKADKILANGVYLTGGGSQMAWLTQGLLQPLKLTHHPSNNCFLDNITGVMKVMQHPKKYQVLKS